MSKINISSCVLGCFVFITLISFAVVPVFSQSSTPTVAPTATAAPSAAEDLSRAIQDYVFTYELYRKAHDEYDLAKGQYETSQTLSSKARAVSATVAMLQARDESTKVYMTLLRRRLVAAVGMIDSERDLMNTKIDIEVAWFDDHKRTVPSAGTLDDLTLDSIEAKTHYTRITIPIIYDILSKVALGKIVDLRTRQSDVIVRVEEEANIIRQDNDPKAQTIERWVLEAKNRFTRSQEKEVETLAIKLKVNNEANDYGLRQGKLREALQYLKDANTFLKEIIREIKTQ